MDLLLRDIHFSLGFTASLDKQHLNNLCLGYVKDLVINQLAI